MRQLLDDERDAFRLRVHCGGRARVDPAAQDLPEELGRLHLGESVELEATNHAKSFHVRHQVHGLRDDGELLGTDGTHEEDRAARVRPDDVAEEPEAVVVGPLEVVDQQGHGALRGQAPNGHGSEVQGSEELLVRREAV